MNTKKDRLVLRVEKRPDLFPLKSLLRASLCALCVLLWQRALAGVHYVDVNSTNATPPYTNWITAATNIQDAVDAAVAGDEVVVTNGIYASGGRDGNRVKVEKLLNVRSINGPQFTTIAGGGTNRCAYLTNAASLSGFTLTNGHSQKGGGAYGGTLNNCTLVGNSASFSSFDFVTPRGVWRRSVWQHPEQLYLGQQLGRLHAGLPWSWKQLDTARLRWRGVSMRAEQLHFEGQRGKRLLHGKYRQRGLRPRRRRSLLQVD